MSVSLGNEWIFLIHTDNRYVITLNTITKHQHKPVRNTCDRGIYATLEWERRTIYVHTRTHAYVDSSHMFRRAKVLWSIVEDFSVQSTLYSVGETVAPSQLDLISNKREEQRRMEWRLCKRWQNENDLNYFGPISLSFCGANRLLLIIKSKSEHRFFSRNEKELKKSQFISAWLLCSTTTSCIESKREREWEKEPHTWIFLFRMSHVHVVQCTWWFPFISAHNTDIIILYYMPTWTESQL